MQVVPVRGRRQMRAFIRVPAEIFANHPCYVPPIWLDEAQAYTGKANPILRNSDFELLLLLDDSGKPIGRTIAYIDRTFNAFYRAKIGFFGAFECIDNAVAAALARSGGGAVARRARHGDHTRADSSRRGKLGICNQGL